MECEDVPDIM